MCFDNHDYDDDTHVDTDDDADDENDHKKNSYTAAGAAPDAGALQNILFERGRLNKNTTAPNLFIGVRNRYPSWCFWVGRGRRIFSPALAITLGSQFLHLGLCWIVLAGPSHGIPCVLVGSSGFSYVYTCICSHTN